MQRRPQTTQIRLSDGVNPVRDWRARPGVTVQKLTYDYLSFDAGAKYRGWSFQSEYYFRWLNDFIADWPASADIDLRQWLHGRARVRMVVPRTVNVYAAAGYVFDQFKRQTVGTEWRGQLLPVPHPVVADQRTLRPHRAITDGLVLRLLHRRTDRDNDLVRDGHLL